MKDLCNIWFSSDERLGNGLLLGSIFGRQLHFRKNVSSPHASPVVFQHHTLKQDLHHQE